MKEQDIWNFFLLTGNIDTYLAYRCIKDMHSAEFAEEENVLNENGKGDGNSNQKD